MAVGAEFKGKAKPSGVPFYKKSSAPAPQPKESHWPLLIGGALAGAAILLILRSRGSSTTGPVLSVYPSGGADSSQIQNMIGSIQAITSNPNTGSTSSSTPPTDSQGAVNPPSVNTPPTPPSSLPANWADLTKSQQFQYYAAHTTGTAGNSEFYPSGTPGVGDHYTVPYPQAFTDMIYQAQHNAGPNASPAQVGASFDAIVKSNVQADYAKNPAAYASASPAFKALYGLPS